MNEPKFKPLDKVRLNTVPHKAGIVRNVLGVEAGGVKKFKYVVMFSYDNEETHDESQLEAA